MTEPPATLTPESITAEISADLITAVNQGVPWMARVAVKAFCGKVVSWAIGLLILKTFGTVYPFLLVLEPIAVQLFLPEKARWFTAAKVLYASKPGTVGGVNLASIVRPALIESVLKPGINGATGPTQLHAPLRVFDGDRPA